MIIVNKNRKCSRGFTLVELLVVIAIIGILIGMLLPAVQQVRAAARRSSCQNNLKNIGLAILNYESAQMKFPAGQKWTANEASGDPNRLDFGWMAEILPHIEAGNVYDQINFDLPYTNAFNRLPIANVIPAYLCPSTAQRDGARGPDELIRDYDGVTGLDLGCTDYMGVSGPAEKLVNPNSGDNYERQQGILIGIKGLKGEERMLSPPAVRMGAVTDGTSETIMVTECSGRGTEPDDDPHGAWISGKNVTHVEGGVNEKKAKASRNDELIFSEHCGGANAVFVDGSVHFLSANTEAEIIVSRCSRSGGELISE